MNDKDRDQTQTETSDEEKNARKDTGTLEFENIKVDTKRASTGGILAAAIVFTGAYLVGEASGSEAKVLLNMSLETTRSFCGTATLALGNILALMLTLLSVSASTDINLKWSHYLRVKQVALFDTITLIGAILIYLLLNVPLEQSEAASTSSGASYPMFYYATLFLASLLGGALIAVVIMLYNTIKDIIEIFGHNGKKHELVQSDDD